MVVSCGTLTQDMHALQAHVTKVIQEMYVAVSILDTVTPHLGVLIQITYGHKVRQNIHQTVDLADNVVQLNGLNKVVAIIKITGQQAQDTMVLHAAADIAGVAGAQAAQQS